MYLFTIYISYSTGNLVILRNSSTLVTFKKFIPLKTTFDYLYFNFDFVPILGSFYYNLYSVCYNQTGRIISTNQTYYNLNSYANLKVTQLNIFNSLSSLNQICGIIAYDINCITDRRLLIQKSYLTPQFDEFNDLRKFYLTIVPYYVKDFAKTTIATKYYYATTILQFRYLRYKTNASDYTTSTTDLLNSQLNSNLETSFSIKFELGTNYSLGVNLMNFKFNTTNYLFEFNNFKIGGIWYKYFSLNGTKIGYTSIFDERIIIHAQLKNNQFIFTLFVNGSIFTTQKIVFSNFEKITISGFRILNSEIKTLKTDSIVNYQNNVLIEYLIHDLLTFKFRISEINTQFSFISIIPIQISTMQSKIYDINNVEYELEYSKILDITFEFDRNSLDGSFTLTNNNEFIMNIFSSIEYEKIFSYNFFIDLSSGNLYLYVNFQNPTNSQTTINCNMNFTRLLVYSDQIPANNLMINKALELLLPLMILGLIVIGFYSDSNSKYLAIVGIYIGVFVFYLMEYMSLLFMVLCFILQTVGLYFIIKHENNGGI